MEAPCLNVLFYMPKCCFYINASWTKPVVHKPPVAELKAARIYFQEPAKRETRRLASRSASDAIILKHETLASIFHVWRIGFWRVDVRQTCG